MKRVIFTSFLLALFILPASLAAFPVQQMVETIYTDWEFSSGLPYGFSGDGHVYDYASYVDFYTCFPDDWIGGIWIGTSSNLEDNLCWQHTLPELTVPPDVVSQAKLYIDAAFVDNNNNMIKIEGTLDWDPLNNHFLDNTNYTLTGIEAEDPGFWDDGLLNCKIMSFENSLRIDRAVLMMDYTSVVPEPTTLILVGMGMFGAAMLRRRK